MKSPFPGMDPYLEQHWGDVHHRLVTYASDQIQTQLPRELRARVEERVFVETDPGDLRGIYPDVRVVEYPVPRTPGGPTPAAGSDVAVAEPLVIVIDDEPARQGYIEIVDVGSGNRVVTVIEFLSPSNKLPGDGREQYQKKQREVRRAGANLVEIDLTRTGTRALLVPPWRVPRTHRTTYQICVFRACKSLQYEVYRAPLQDPLPKINVPLRETDADVSLDIQALIDLCYRNGRYDDLDYRAAPEPPLEEADAAWANELLKEKGVR